jgi:hypothetical protein
MNRSLLEQGEIVVEGRLVDASNATLFVRILKEESSLSAIYKPISGERPLWDFTSGNLAQRERAAYLVSEALGFRCVPYTILRDGPFGIGMVQEWIDVDDALSLEEYFQQDEPQLRQVALFDAIINNTDRKIGHLLPTKEGKLYVCDHGVTFHHDDKLRTVLWQWAGSSLLKGEIEIVELFLDFLSTPNASELRTLISAEEYKALELRTSRLLTEQVFPSPREDWPHIPWPPF